MVLRSDGAASLLDPLKYANAAVGPIFASRCSRHFAPVDLTVPFFFHSGLLHTRN